MADSTKGHKWFGEVRDSCENQVLQIPSKQYLEYASKGVGVGVKSHCVATKVCFHFSGFLFLSKK